MLASPLKRLPERNTFSILQDLDNPAAATTKRSEVYQDKRHKSAVSDVFRAPGPLHTARDNHFKNKNASARRRNSLPSMINGVKQGRPSLPRIDSVRPDATPLTDTKFVDATTLSSPRPQTTKPPLSLWDYLQLELSATDTDEAQEFKRERIKNFMILPDALERTLFFGFIVCLDSFLYIFTILPMRLLRALFNLANRLSRARVSLKSSEKVDILKSALILLTCLILNQLDASRIYHNIRGQAAIKLYVLYNVLEIGDKLFCALGQDILDCLFSKSTFGRREDGSQRHLRPLAFFLLALIYNVLHTVLLFYQVVTLNVTVNSFSNALMTLLLSNQFVEIKGSVFKKFEKEGLFQITCADMVERFQLFIMLLIIGLRNTFEMGPSSMTEILTTTVGPMLTVLGSEILVDWLKHAFITKFNHVRPTIYARFTDVLCRDYVNSATSEHDAYVDQSPAISRRIGLPVLPLICLTIRSSSQIVSMVLEREREDFVSLHDANWEAKTLRILGYVFFAISVLSMLIIAKLCLGVSIIRYAHARYSSMKLREEQESRFEAERKRKNVYTGVVEVDADTKAILNDIRDNLQGQEVRHRGGLFRLERYSMISKRIW